MPLPSSPANLQLADRMAGVVPNAIGELLRHGADPSVISFAGGYPDASLFPVEGIRTVMDELLDGRHNTALQYTVSDGLPELREQVARFMRADGLDIGADDVLILQGGQQGLDLAGKLVLNPGDAVVTENPTFLGALIAFAPNQPVYAPVAYDVVDWNQPAAVIIGGEAEGVSPQLTAWASEMVGIPLAAGVESLNAAVAGSVVLFEAARQRRLSGA